MAAADVVDGTLVRRELTVDIRFSSAIQERSEWKRAIQEVRDEAAALQVSVPSLNHGIGTSLHLILLFRPCHMIRIDVRQDRANCILSLHITGGTPEDDRGLANQGHRD